MKCAVNPPESAPELDLGSLSYGLAHEALKSEGYLQRLKEIAKSHRYLIFDNGADELGEGMNGDEYYDLLQEIKPQEMILPDVLGNTQETLDRGRKFLDERDLSGMKVMAVSQGLNFDDWMNCYFTWVADDRVDVIGVPYDIEFDAVAGVQLDETTDFTKTELRAVRRFNIINYIMSTTPAGGEGKVKPIHLLGMNNLEELRLYGVAGFDAIRSNDTTSPFGSALAGRTWVNGESGERDYPSLRFDVSQEEMRSAQAVSLYNLMAYFAAANDLGGLQNLMMYVKELA